MQKSGDTVFLEKQDIVKKRTHLSLTVMLRKQ